MGRLRRRLAAILAGRAGDRRRRGRRRRALRYVWDLVRRVVRAPLGGVILL